MRLTPLHLIRPLVATGALVGALVVGAVSFAQEGEAPAAEADAPAAETPVAEADAPADADQAITEDGVVPTGDVNVDEAIANYREKGGTPREFNAAELSWISQGLAVDALDLDSPRSVYKGYSLIPTGDDNVVLYLRNAQPGDKPTAIESGASTLSPPIAQNVPPFLPSVDEGSFWLPVAASDTAREVDAMFNFIMWTNYIFTALIGVLMVVFCIKYRRRPGVRADQTITHNTPLEIFWSVVPTILVAIMFWGGYTTFLDMRTPPPDTMDIHTTAKQWGWAYKYDNGVAPTTEIHVPENTPIKMVMTSDDVIHSFHLPAFRVKSDVLPNRYTEVWFDSGEPGIYPVYCAEYCGQDHANMYTLLVVEPMDKYEAWVAKEKTWWIVDGEPMEPVAVGKEAFKRNACGSCHSVTGDKGTGPTFAGLYGANRKFEPGLSRDAADRFADDDYIMESIRNPHAQIVKGYTAQMSNFSDLATPQVEGLIAYIKSLKDVERKYSGDTWED